MENGRGELRGSPQRREGCQGENSNEKWSNGERGKIKAKTEGDATRNG
jgi:hypothetical protein